MKKQAIKILPNAEQLTQMDKLIEKDVDLGDNMTEAVFEMLVDFNHDMKTMAMNTYQMQELLELSILENRLMVEWCEHLEQQTLDSERVITDLEEFQIERILTQGVY